MIFQEAFEWHIAVYLFLAGVGAGAIVTASLADLYNREKYIAYIKAASIIGMPLVAIGTFFLVIDLGQGLYKPWLLIFLFANPTSAIMWGTLILTLFIIVSALYAAYNFGYLKFGGGKVVTISLIILGICTAGYTAVLLGVLKAIPFWHQTALPILFIISATSTGISGTVIVKEAFLKQEGDIKALETGHLYLLVLEFILLIGMIFIALQSVPEMVFSVKVLLTGAYSFEFWVLLMLIGLIIPIYYFIRMEAYGLHFSRRKLLTLETMVLIGGFYLRFLIIHAGVYTDKFIN